MRVPEHLSHKPIIAVDNYHKLDGIHKEGTDAKGLSIGRAQWDDDGKEISAKVWRKRTKDKDSGWSRQSEELPLHRVLDLAILILSVYNSPEEFPSSEEEKTFLGETLVDEKGLEDIKNFFEEKEAEDENVFKDRIKELRRLLEEVRS